jgi:uncharacterized phage protein gp47/JayE
MSLTSTGYDAPDSTEIVENMSANAVTEFGSLMDTSVDSVMGHLIGVTSIEISNLYQDLLELYSNLNPNTAEGRMLENLALLGGLVRKNRAYSTGVVTFTGPVATSIPEGTVIYVIGAPTRRFLTSDSETIPAEGSVRVRVRAETSGATAAPLGTLTELDVAITGTTVTNEKDIVIGTDTIEEDAALRARRNNTLTIGGNGTVLAIRAALEQLDGVTAVRVINNPTMSYVARGDGVYLRPPNSVEVVVEGGDEEDIIRTIVFTKSASTDAFGMLMVSYTDFQGNIHQVRYTRPDLQDITIDVKYRVYNEETFPVDGEDRIVEEILSFASTEYELGKDVLRDRLYVPIFNVTGVANADILIGRGDALPLASLSEDDIPIELYEKANITSSNITVTRII